MGLFFGTDGLRGKVQEDLSFDVCYKCGNALGVKYPNSKIILGRDTRHSGDFVALSCALGMMSAGLSVVDVGVCPTAGVSYLVKHLGFDFGVVISASHNPAEFNGIKIFDKNGRKLGDERECELEKLFLKTKTVEASKLGSYEYSPRKTIIYQNFLTQSLSESLQGLKIVLDLANGAGFKIAPAVFRNCGAKIISLNSKPNGFNINKNCGALHIKNLQKNVIKHKANIGFAFDGDSDRVIAVDEKGEVVDGDKILYLFAKHYHQLGLLKPPVVVGTRHTNVGVEKALIKAGVSLIRTDIGDKYVSAKLDEQKLLIGGEQSGHIIVKNKHTTGDGILNALLIAEICKHHQKTLSQFFNFQVYHQSNVNVEVKDKMKIINSQKLADAEMAEQQALDGRIMIRVSGTEPFIRIMVESQDGAVAESVSKRLENVIREVDEGCD